MRCGNENIVRIELWHHKWCRPLAAMRRLFVWVALGAGLVAGTAQMAQAASDEAQLLRLDSYDAFMQSADQFAIGTGTSAGLLSVVQPDIKKTPVWVKSRKWANGDAAYLAQVLDEMRQQPEASFAIAHALQKAHPFRRDLIRQALAKLMTQKKAHSPAQGLLSKGQLQQNNHYTKSPISRAAGFENTAISAPAALGLLKSASDSLAQNSLNFSTAPAIVSGGVSMTTMAFYSLGVAGIVGSDWRDGPTCSNCSNPLGPATDFEGDEYDNQSGLNAISASYAYSLGYDGEGVLVSVIDSPFDLDHPDLSDTFVAGYHIKDDDYEADECVGGGCSRSHGTHVAGIIAANKDNAGIHGVAYKAKIRPVAYLTMGGVTSSEFEAAVEAASGQFDGEQILAANNSWGSSPDFTTISPSTSKLYRIPDQNPGEALVREAPLISAVDNGTIFVWSAGNDGWNSETGQVAAYDNEGQYGVVNPTYLDADDVAAMYDNISGGNQISALKRLPELTSDADAFIIDADEKQYRWVVVVATDPNNDNQIASYSNACAETQNYCIAAPGTQIYSTDDAGTYSIKSGTSMAAPHVTGAIALLGQRYPNLEPEEIVAILLKTATDKGATGVDPIYGNGVMDLEEAMQPYGEISALAMSFGALNSLPSEASITLPAAFGSDIPHLSFAIQDEYDRVYEKEITVQRSGPSQLALSDQIQEMSQPETTPQQLHFTDGSRLQFDVDNAQDIQAVEMHYLAEMNGHKMALTFASQPEAQQLAANQSGFFADDKQTGYATYFDAASQSGVLVHLASLQASQQHASGLRLGTALKIAKQKNGSTLAETTSSWGWATQSATVNLTLGGLVETASLLGGSAGGALALADGSRTLFARLDTDIRLGQRDNLELFFVSGRTYADFKYEALARLSDMTSDTYGMRWKRMLDETGNSQLDVKLWRPMASTSGQLSLQQVMGNHADDLYASRWNHYELAGPRETALSADIRRAIGSGHLKMGFYAKDNAGHIKGRSEQGGYLASYLRF